MRAQLADAAVLAGLALTAKAVRSHYATSLRARRARLTIMPDHVSRQPTRVIERQGQALGLPRVRIGGAVAKVAQVCSAPAILGGRLPGGGMRAAAQGLRAAARDHAG